ncbi:MAG: transcriptional regulator [Phycisphaeraceae bacterium]|nr:transcriptional regulator [Phycisphaeraceae bacterium]
MARSSPPSPTAAELTILTVLWEHGPCSVREVADALSKTHPTGYTTKLKLLQVMLSKGLVSRDDSNRAHRYTASVSRNRVQRHVVRSMIDRAFGGSARNLVMHLLRSRELTDEEIDEARRMLRDQTRE